jgi:DNA repair exonuclease SbcCD ATPase subunit
MESQEAQDELIKWLADCIIELEAEVERLESALEKLEGDYDTALQWNIELEEQLASARAEVERLKKSNDHHHEQLMNRIRIGNEIKYEVDCENERLRSALDAIISKLRREGCTSRGCDQEIHTMQCPMEVALLLEQALKG